MLYERTLGQWLEHWATTTPDKEYIVYSDRNLRFTWSQFNRRVDDMAKGLIAIGVERGTHVGIWAANVPDWLTLLYACAKIGAVYVTVNTNYKQAELEYLCENSDMHTLCIVNGEKDSDFVQMTYTMLPELKTCQRGHLKSERFPYMKNVIYVGQEKHRGMYNTSEILLLGDNVEDTRLNELKSRVSCHDVVNMQYTSGTTGFPKGVMLTHYNITNNGFLTGEHMKFTAADKLCCCVPLFHCFGVVLATMNCLTHGCTQVMVERFNPLVVLASIHKERCTALYGVPTMFIAELHHPMFDLFDMSSLRTGIMAGSLCPVELMKQVEELTDGAISGKSIQIGLSVGVAVSVGISMLRVLTGISIFCFLVPGYAIALILSLFVPKIFTAIAFDSGGVASGPMTATFMLQFFMGASIALGGNVLQDAFGVVALVAMMPLVSIQLVGLFYERKQKRTKETTVVYGDYDIVELWEGEHAK